MNKKPEIPFWLHLATLLLIGQICGASLINGDFELFEPNCPGGFSPPSSWQTENYVAVHSKFVPNPESSPPVFWTIPQAYSGEYFVVLSTGDCAPDRDIKYARMWQTITLEQGDTIQGVYFFGTCDYRPFIDKGSISLIPDPNLSPGKETLILADPNVLDVGDFMATRDWVPFKRTISPDEAGTYTLLVTVEDVLDTIYKSYIALDGLNICKNAPEYGDLNYDCNVDMRDFTVLAADWLKNCADPNTPCREDTDIDGDGKVDIVDFDLMYDNWKLGDNL